MDYIFHFNTLTQEHVSLSLALRDAIREQEGRS